LLEGAGPAVEASSDDGVRVPPELVSLVGRLGVLLVVPGVDVEGALVEGCVGLAVLVVVVGLGSLPIGQGRELAGAVLHAPTTTGCEMSRLTRLSGRSLRSAATHQCLRVQ